LIQYSVVRLINFSSFFAFRSLAPFQDIARYQRPAHGIAGSHQPESAPVEISLAKVDDVGNFAALPFGYLRFGFQATRRFQDESISDTPISR